jgi:hypothetical protein
MKKNILRVISLMLVAGLLLAFCSCTQEILVRFVDKDGNDLDLSGISIGGGAAVPANNSTPATTAAPADNSTPDTTAAPADNAADNSGDNAAAPAADNTASTGKPSTKDEVIDFYKNAVARVKNNGEAGYSKKEWQVIGNLNITGIGMVDSAIENVVAGYATTEDEAEVQVSAKGSDDAKNRCPPFTLTDYSKVASAECTEANGNYKITIVMQDEDTPKAGTFLKEVTDSVLLWEDIEKEVKENVSIVKDFTDVHVNYQGYKIEAEITPDGKFVTLDQTAHVDIKIGSAKILIATLKDKSGTLDNYMKLWDFQY